MKILILEKERTLHRSYALGIERFFNEDRFNYELDLIDKPEEIKTGYDIYFIGISYCREIEEFRIAKKNNKNYFILLGIPYSMETKEISKNYDEIISKEDVVNCLKKRLRF